MKNDFTSINIILDRSSSMGKLSNETIYGFNSFLAEQKKVPGTATLTLATFASDYKLIHDFVDIQSVKELTEVDYLPAGYTALLDAIGYTIDTTGKKLSEMNEEERPSKIIVLIITDGQDNVSKKFKHSEIFDKITHQRTKYSWEVIFMGISEDQVQGAVNLGVAAHNSVAYTADSAGISSAYSAISGSMTNYRKGIAKQVDFFNQNKK